MKINCVAKDGRSCGVLVAAGQGLRRATPRVERLSGQAMAYRHPGSSHSAETHLPDSELSMGSPYFHALSRVVRPNATIVARLDELSDRNRAVVLFSGGGMAPWLDISLVPQSMVLSV